MSTLEKFIGLFFGAIVVYLVLTPKSDTKGVITSGFAGFSTLGKTLQGR